MFLTQPLNPRLVSCISMWFFTTSATWEAIGLMETTSGELANWEVLKLIIAVRFLLSCKVWYPSVPELVQGHPWEAFLCPPYKASGKKSLWVPPKEASWEHARQGDWTLFVWACVLIHTHTHTHFFPKPLENKWLTWCSITPKHFNVYFLKSTILSYVITVHTSEAGN